MKKIIGPASPVYAPEPLQTTLTLEDGVVLEVSSPIPLSVTSGEKLVATAGTAERLTAESTPATSGIVQVIARLNNTGVVYVGGDTVDAATGYPLAQGDTLVIPLGDATDVWLDAANDGDSVRFLVS